MTTQPEALRLADRLRDGWGLELRREAEAELRRLHAESERCYAEALKLSKERIDAKCRCNMLLEALYTISLAAQDSESTREGIGLYARAAIAKAEENP